MCKRFLPSLFLMAICCCTDAQNDILPIDKWRKELSIRHDTFSGHYKEILDALVLLDSTQQCEVVAQLKRKSRASQKRLQIRLAMLQAVLNAPYKECGDTNSVVRVLENALYKAYELDDPYLIADLNLLFSRYYHGRYEFGMGVVYQQNAVEIQNRLGVEKFSNVAYQLHELGDILYHAQHYRESVNASLQGVFYPGNAALNYSDTLNAYTKMNAWNSAGICYERLAMYDSALIAFDKAYAIAVKYNMDEFWQGLILGNRGDVFFLQEKYDSAEALLKYDYEQSMVSRQFDNAALTLSRLAKIESYRGNHTHALSMMREASAIEQRMQHPGYRAEMLQTFALVFKNLGNADSTFHYQQEYKIRSDALERGTAASRQEIVQLRMQNKEDVYRIISLNREKGRIILIRNFILLLTLLGAIFAYVFLHRERLKLRLRQQQAVQDKYKAEAEAESVKEQLDVFTQHLFEKTALVEELQAKLVQKKEADDLAKTDEELMQQTILTDDDWEKFRALFDRVYPGFFTNLKSQTPDITLAEQRMAALIKLQVPAKKAASILGISPNSVHKTRQRLRHRLGLETDAELTTYFEQSS